MLDLAIVGAQVVFPREGVRRVDIGVRDGRIAAIAAPGGLPQARETIDGAGRHLFPGVIDPHVHFGLYQPWASDWVTESQSAAIGGVTTVIDFFRTGASYHEVWPRLIAEAEAGSSVDFGMHLGLLTERHLAELPEYVSQYGVTSFKFYYFQSGRVREIFGAPDPLTLDDGDLARCLRRLRAIDPGLLLCVHCENMALNRAALLEHCPPKAHTLAAWNLTRPDYVETTSVLNALTIARALGARIYVVHLTAGSSVDALRAQSALLDETGSVIESCCHYLALTVDAPTGLLAKVIPPVRHAKDRDGLWHGVAEGIVTTIGSDHCASRRDLKGGERLEETQNAFAAAGPSLAVLLTEGYHLRGIPLETIADITSRRVAETFNLAPRKGLIAVGADADLTLVDLERGLRVEVGTFGGSSDYDVFEGYTLRALPVLTLLRGQVTARDGRAVGQPGRGRYLRRDIQPDSMVGATS